jgi:hypothetical protein
MSNLLRQKKSSRVIISEKKYEPIRSHCTHMSTRTKYIFQSHLLTNFHNYTSVTGL